VTDIVNVAHVNQPPVAKNDTYPVLENPTLKLVVNGRTSISATSQAGDWVGQGLGYSFRPPSTTITGFVRVGAGPYTNTAEIHSVGPNGECWYDDFATPNLARLTPGSYPNATRWPLRAAGVAGLDVSGDSRRGNTSVDKFTVTEATYDPSGKLLSFAASFVQHGEGATSALTGQVNYNATGGRGSASCSTTPTPRTTSSPPASFPARRTGA
jgi:hypothetical protein